MACGPITSWQIDLETMETVTDFIFLGSKITADGDCSHEIKRHLLLGRKTMTNLYSILKSRDITLPTKVHLVRAMVFPVVMYGCESWNIKKAEWAPKNWCFWTVVLEKTFESPLYCKIKPVNTKGNQSWVFFGRTDAEAETPILWTPDVKNWLIGKDPDAGKDWRQEKKEPTEDEIVEWHHWLNGHEFEQAPIVGDGQGSLVCYSPWSQKESDMTEQLNLETELGSYCSVGLIQFRGELWSEIFPELYLTWDNAVSVCILHNIQSFDIGFPWRKDTSLKRILKLNMKGGQLY